MADHKPHTVLGAMDIMMDKKPWVAALMGLTALGRIHLNLQAFKIWGDKCDDRSNPGYAERL